MNTDLLVYEAKAFYNAYINLENTYLEDGSPLFFAPMAVNGAFAIELSLKALLTKLDVPYEKEHNLLILFKKLPDRIQKVYWRILENKAPEFSDEQKRMEELLLISEVFADWRYWFENNKSAPFNSRFLSVFANSAIWLLFGLGFNVDLVEDKSEIDEAQIEIMLKNERKEALDSLQKRVEKKQRGNKDEASV